jgi:hypothetical protein
LRRILGPRAGLSSVLIIGAVVLVGAIVVGNSMGNRVLGQIGAHPFSSVPSPVAPSAAPSDVAEKNAGNWKKTQVMAVATDPGFPDPRVTPEPPPPETPRPRPRATASSAPQPRFTFDLNTGPTISPSTTPSVLYTSPPLPIPIATHLETATPEPDETPSPRPSGRGTPIRYTSPTLPPIPVQTLNP